MARNGYTYQQPQNVFFDQIQKMFGGKRQISFGDTVSNAANQAQIAAAVTDATCTESADLAGIYFAVQASYEQQIVNANQQALNSAVQQYKAAYVKELKKLPSLLKTAKANKFPKIPPTRKG
jgi:succinylglutamate desuccinylase